MQMRRGVAVLVSLSLVLVYGTPASSPVAIGKMTSRGKVEVNGTASPADGSVFPGDRIATKENSAVAMALPGGDQVFLPEWTQARIESVAGGVVRIVLERGALASVVRGKTPVTILARGVAIEPVGVNALFEVALKESGLRVMTRRGTAIVRGSNKTVEVKEGSTLDATTGAPPTPQPPQGAGASGLTPLMTTVIVASTALGITGFAMGLAALNRTEPQDCQVTGSTSPFTITCP